MFILLPFISSKCGIGQELITQTKSDLSTEELA